MQRCFSSALIRRVPSFLVDFLCNSLQIKGKTKGFGLANRVNRLLVDILLDFMLKDEIHQALLTQSIVSSARAKCSRDGAQTLQTIARIRITREISCFR